MPLSGVFGKMPQTGDFLSRGLQPKLRRPLDLWMSQHLAGRANWPDGGLRGLLRLEEDTLTLFVATGSQDAVRRQFPLAVVTDGAGLSYEAAEAWCNKVAPRLALAAAGDLNFEDFAHELDALPDLPRGTEDGVPSIWTKGGAPCLPVAESLDALFSSD